MIYAKAPGRGEALDKADVEQGWMAPPLPSQSGQEPSADTTLYSAFSKELGSCGRVWGLRAAGSGNSPKLGGYWVVWGSLPPQGLYPNCSETTDTQGLIVDGHPM